MNQAGFVRGFHPAQTRHRAVHRRVSLLRGRYSDTAQCRTRDKHRGGYDEYPSLCTDARHLSTARHPAPALKLMGNNDASGKTNRSKIETFAWRKKRPAASAEPDATMRDGSRGCIKFVKWHKTGADQLTVCIESDTLDPTDAPARAHPVPMVFRICAR